MGGSTSVRMVSTRSAVSSACGEVSGSAVSTMRSPSGADGRRRDRADARRGLELAGHRRDVRLGVAAPSSVDDDLERTVEARSEALGEHVVGPAQGVLGAEVPVIGEADAQRGGGRGDHSEQCDRGDEVADRVVGHVVGPPARPAWAGSGRGTGMRTTRRLLMRLPARPSSAGSSVRAASIVTATMSAEVQPIAAIIGTPASWSPAIARTTVLPAKRTESPAVALALPTESCSPTSVPMFSRCRARTKSA